MIIETYLKPHLAEYLTHKYSEGKQILLPNYLLMCLLNNLRPVTDKTKLAEEVNVAFIVTGKKLYEKSNTCWCLSSNSRSQFQAEVDWCFWVEAESFIEATHRKGESLSSSYYSFLETYKIDSLSYDAVKKHFFRKKIQNK